MTSQNPHTPLAQFILEWVEANNTNGSSLYKESGVPTSSFSALLKGSIHTAPTLRKLAEVMGVPHRKLFELAGYVQAEELEPEDIDIADPEISLFFRGYDWDEFTEAERDLVKMGIRMALAHHKARLESGAPATSLREYERRQAEGEGNLDRTGEGQPDN